MCVNNYKGKLGDGERIPTVIESDGDEERCPHCGNWYKKIATHWTTSSDCQWPPINQYKIKLLTGLMLGDGRMQVSRGCFGCDMTNKTFLQWLTNELDWLVGDVTMQRTAVEQAKTTRESLDRETKSSDAFDLYQILSRPHPTLERFVAWYDTGEIVFPTNVELTPTILRMWYVSDGGINWNNGNPVLQFTSCNESNRPEVIEGMLESAGFTVQHGKGSQNFYIPNREIEQFFDYVGQDHVPGFEYKWAYDGRDRYDRLKREMEEQHCTRTLNN